MAWVSEQHLLAGGLPDLQQLEQSAAGAGDGRGTAGQHQGQQAGGQGCKAILHSSHFFPDILRLVMAAKQVLDWSNARISFPVRIKLHHADDGLDEDSMGEILTGASTLECELFLLSASRGIIWPRHAEVAVQPP